MEIFVIVTAAVLIIMGSGIIFSIPTYSENKKVNAKLEEMMKSGKDIVVEKPDIGQCLVGRIGGFSKAGGVAALVRLTNAKSYSYLSIGLFNEHKATNEWVGPDNIDNVRYLEDSDEEFKESLQQQGITYCKSELKRFNEELNRLQGD